MIFHFHRVGEPSRRALPHSERGSRDGPSHQCRQPAGKKEGGRAPLPLCSHCAMARAHAFERRTGEEEGPVCVVEESEARRDGQPVEEGEIPRHDEQTLEGDEGDAGPGAHLA